MKNKLSFRGNGGFTLVELIVVIAILAILAGVAVPAYSGYIDRSNKTTDLTQVREVINALEIQYYSDRTDFEGMASVILTENGSKVAENDGKAFAEEAMLAAFGTTDLSGIKLTHKGWLGASTTSAVLGHFQTQINAGSELSGIYTGEEKASFSDEIDELFGMVEETATDVFQRDESAAAVKGAAEKTVNGGMTASQFASAWATAADWGSIRSRNSASNCRPKLERLFHLPVTMSRSPTTGMGIMPTTVTVVPPQFRRSTA